MKTLNKNLIKIYLSGLFYLFFLTKCVFAQEKTLGEMSLKELMNVEVITGSLTMLPQFKIPVSLTIITSEDIAVTPARNIADLIEIYVPGAIWLNHTSPKIGFRGIIKDNNANFLLFVNNIDVSFKGAHGALLELCNWDLNDIESIEIIRGPGSVTYGTGALSSIINIITKNANTSKGISIGAETNLLYNSNGVYSSMGYTKKKFNLYGYGSLRYTKGYKNADYFAIDPNTGISGYIDPSQGEGVMPIFGDNLGKPQVKLHFDANLFKEWRLWARYTNSDQPALFRQKMIQADDKIIPYWFTGQKGVFTVLENKHSFNENIILESKASYSSQNYYDYWVTHPELPYDEGGFNSPHGAGNIVYNFSESHFLLSSIVNINRADEKYKLAFGANYYYDLFRPAWGRDKMYMLSNDYMTPDGRYIEDVIANGFETYTISFLSEGNLELHPVVNLLLSARIDKNNFSNYFFSPRIGIISELSKTNILKLIWQRSVRSDVYQYVYHQHLNNNKVNPEILNSFQTMYNYLPTSSILANVSASYNWIEMLGFVYDPITIKGASKPIGNLKYFSIEAEVKYKMDKATVGINHSYVKQISWVSAEGVTAQAISYSDYNFNGLQSTGNDLNNMANNSTKLITNVKLPYNFNFHADAAIFWKWEGYKDVQKMYSSKYGSTDSTWNVLNKKLVAEDFAGTDIRLNISISKYFPKIKSTLSFYGMNLLGSKRYSLSTGERYNYPSRIMWVKEPFTLGAKISVNFLDNANKNKIKDVK